MPGSREDNRCQVCQQPIGGTYYEVNTAMVCPGCAEKMRGELTMDTHAAFVRALAYGVGAAVVGLVGYALIAIVLQGWVISYMSIGVGWIVGTAMMKGSNGVGGRRYQIAAVVLTYAAVSMAAIPIWIHFAGERHRQEQAQDQKFEEQERKFGQRIRAAANRTARTTDEPGRVAGRRRRCSGLASPFTELASNPGSGSRWDC